MMRCEWLGLGLWVIALAGVTACGDEGEWGEPGLNEDQDELARAGVASPPPQQRVVDHWEDEHTVTCRQPAGAQQLCGAAAIQRVPVGGIPSLSEFCGRAKPLYSQLDDDRMWVKWAWCPAGSSATCNPLSISTDKPVASLYVGDCEAVVRVYSWYYSNVTCASGRCAWTDADVSHCPGVKASDPVTIKYF